MNTRIFSVENNPLNNYVGFKKDDNSNKNDSSSSLSLNTSFIKTYNQHNIITVRFPNAFFEEKRTIGIMLNMGCNNMETLKNGDVILKEGKPGAAAVIHSLESGGAYCQEA